MNRIRRWDGPFWGVCLVVTLVASAFGCFGLAASKLSRNPQADILTTDNCPPPADL